MPIRPSFRGSYSSIESFVGNGTLNLTVPTNLINDLIICHIFHNGSGTVGVSGFTQIGTTIITDNKKSSIWYKRVSTEESSISVNIIGASGSQITFGIASVIMDCITSGSPIDVVDESVSWTESNTVSSLEVGITSENTLAVNFEVSENETLIGDWSDFFIERYDFNDSQKAQFSFADQEPSSGGLQPENAVLDLAAFWVCHTVAFIGSTDNVIFISDTSVVTEDYLLQNGLGNISIFDNIITIEFIIVISEYNVFQFNNVFTNEFIIVTNSNLGINLFDNVLIQDIDTVQVGAFSGWNTGYLLSLLDFDNVITRSKNDIETIIGV